MEPDINELQAIIAGYNLGAHQKTECIRAAKIAHLEEQLAAAQETIVAAQARIAELLNFMEDKDAVVFVSGDTAKDNLSALHENNARVLEEAASEMILDRDMNYLMDKAEEYRAKANKL